MNYQDEIRKLIRKSNFEDAFKMLKTYDNGINKNEIDSLESRHHKNEADFNVKKIKTQETYDVEYNSIRDGILGLLDNRKTNKAKAPEKKEIAVSISVKKGAQRIFDLSYDNKNYRLSFSSTWLTNSVKLDEQVIEENTNYFIYNKPMKFRLRLGEDRFDCKFQVSFNYWTAKISKIKLFINEKVYYSEY